MDILFCNFFLLIFCKFLLFHLFYCDIFSLYFKINEFREEVTARFSKRVRTGDCELRERYIVQIVSQSAVQTLFER